MSSLIKIFEFTWILLFLFQKVHSRCYPVWSFECHENEHWTWLSDENLNEYSDQLNDTESNGDTTIHTIKRIYNVNLGESGDVLRDEICEKYKYLKKLWITSGRIVKINENALANCKDLIVFRATENKISGVLKRKIFAHNTKLEEIWLQENEITSIENGAFNHLKELDVLDLGANFLTMFSSVFTDGLKNLQLLAIYSNDLTNIDMENIMRNSPKLEIFYFNDNCFNCTRTTDIKRELDKKNVRTSVYSIGRTRSFITSKAGDFICVPDSKWAQLYGSARIVDSDSHGFTTNNRVHIISSADRQMLKSVFMMSPIIVLLVNKLL